MDGFRVYLALANELVISGGIGRHSNGRNFDLIAADLNPKLFPSSYTRRFRAGSGQRFNRPSFRIESSECGRR